MRTLLVCWLSLVYAVLLVPSCEEDRRGDEEESDDDQDRGDRRGRSLDQKADHKTDERGADPQQNRVDAKTCSFHGENKSNPSLDAPQIWRDIAI